MLPSLSEVAGGRWPGILAALNIEPEYLSGKRTTCPVCGTDKKHFRFDDKGIGSWICTCGAGDGAALLMAVHGWNFKETMQKVKSVAASAVPVPVKMGPTDAQKRHALRKLYEGSRPVVEGDPVWRYLKQRDIEFVACLPLRYHPTLMYRNEDTGAISNWDGMLATVIAPTGEAATLHRTYLKDGEKAPVLAPKKLMPGFPCAGGAIRLFPHGDTLGVAEGIETALAAHELFDVPVWATYSAAMLAEFVWPETVKRLIIFSDNDASYTGQKAAYQLAWRASQKGLTVEVMIPKTVDTDWADAL